MKKITWRKHHKWFGILFAFFMLMFCVSGVVLNHREALATVNVSRQYLPESYRFKKWNGGLLRRSLRFCDADSSESVLLYGTGGIWKTDSAAVAFVDFNEGIPGGADFRTIKAMAQMPDGTLIAGGQFQLYRWERNRWTATELPLDEGERLTDLISRGDTLWVASRSYLYRSLPPYSEFTRLTLLPPAGYDGKVSLFRTIWLLHSGELFGWGGKLLMDGVAFILVVLCITGILYWLLPKYIRRARRNGGAASRSVKALKGSLSWHDWLGRYTIVILLFVSFTGWILRPPLLLAIVQGKVSPIPGTYLDSSNAWHDKLRMIRYDEVCGDWLIHTSEGFYSLVSLDSVPAPVRKAPPVSVMGLNVWQTDSRGNWLTGSFSGMFVWNRLQHTATDYFTGEAAPEEAGPPFGKRAISGYSADMGSQPFVVEYNEGTDAVAMPASFVNLPMSLWNLALEVHTGRIYTMLGPGTLIYIFFAGLAAMWCLYTGYKVRRKK